MAGIKLVCFDVDGTLVDGICWLFLTKGLGCSIESHVDIFQQAKSGKISFRQGEEMLVSMYRQSNQATKVFIEKIFAKVNPRPEAEGLIAYLKKKGYLVYFISGGVDLYVRAVVKKLGADGFFANSRLEFDEEGVLKRFHYRGNQAKVKARQLKRLIKKLGVGLDEVAFIGDGENDLEVFKLTGKGIAVQSSCEELKKVAWKTVGSLEKIKSIL
ncbi:MAG: HAD family phosphatase [bacterium]|nr:HAD family phosphatase [bacterium]